MNERALSGPVECVIFDCDSTLSKIEGIDELGRDHRVQIEELTEKAMSGALPLEEVYKQRLEIVAPTQRDLAEIGQRYIDEITPGALEVVQALISLHKRVCVVSGGIRQAVAPFAHHLGVSGERVFAVDVFLDRDGRYTGFDQHNRLTQNRGKVNIIADLRGEGRRTALVGDGSTDMLCAPYVDRFIGFGGVVRREAVASRAELYVEHPSLAATLPYLLTPFELSKLEADDRFHALHAQALASME